MKNGERTTSPTQKAGFRALKIFLCAAIRDSVVANSFMLQNRQFFKPAEIYILMALQTQSEYIKLCGS